MQRPIRATLKNPELLALTALALLTRFWGLFTPRTVVWDEIHFERYASAYLTHVYYVDVHPPLGKLLLALSAKLFGLSGDSLAALDPAPALRIFPALAGVLIIPVVYLLVVELGVRRKVATLVAAFLLLDNALLVESRLILMDSMLILFGMSALLFYTVARQRSGAAHWIWLVAAAIAAGMAASTKWTGLSALGLILPVWCAEAVATRRKLGSVAGEAAVLVALPLAIYVGAFAVHFALLNRAESQPFVQSFLALNHEMQSINLGWATDTNNGASLWYTWPIAKHSMGLWTHRVPGSGEEQWIVLFGNPIVWWGALAGGLATVIAAVRRNRSLARYRTLLIVLAAGYALNFLPFAFITRPMYLYHYFFALIFSLMIAGVGVGAMAGWSDDGDSEPFWQFSLRRATSFYCTILALATVSFVYLAPFSYGWRTSNDGAQHRRWVLERHFSAAND